MRMPFGKHKGEELADIETSYLRWLEDNVDLRPDLAEALSEELDTRDDYDSCGYFGGDD